MRAELIPPSAMSKGNILWSPAKPMRNGVFPKDHPVTAEAINAFRVRGYWASCFPEGDGITFDYDPPDSQRPWLQVRRDVVECFGFEVA